MSIHRFALGQKVRFVTGTGMRPGSGDVYKITGTLPPRDNLPQYRIRNEEEGHERVTTEDRLEGLALTGGNAADEHAGFFRTRDA